MVNGRSSKNGIGESITLTGNDSENEQIAAAVCFIIKETGSYAELNVIFCILSKAVY
jgi:hypothetical protein